MRTVRYLGCLLFVFVSLCVGVYSSYTQCYGGRCLVPTSVFPIANPYTIVGPVHTAEGLHNQSGRGKYEHAKPYSDGFGYVHDFDNVIAKREDEFISKGFDGPDGRRIRCDMPMSLYIRNTGGSDGAGLCVFTSIYHTGVYNGLPLSEFRRFMERQPGGGYPEKVDRMLKRYCSSKGVYLPNYVHVYNKSSLGYVRKSLSRGNMVCITWGTDHSHYGGQRIAHMVNCVYLDDQWGAILDNNYPNEFLWVKRPTFDNYAAISVVPGDNLWSIIFFDNPMPSFRGGVR